MRCRRDDNAHCIDLAQQLGGISKCGTSCLCCNVAGSIGIGIDDTDQVDIGVPGIDQGVKTAEVTDTDHPNGKALRQRAFLGRQELPSLAQSFSDAYRV